jgi:hypothetical protein
MRRLLANVVFRARYTLLSTNIRVPKSAHRDDDCVNQPRAFSGTGERSGGRGRKRTHRGDPGRSPRLGAENETVRKYLALLGILREAGTGARIALASTTEDWIFGRNRIGSPRATLRRDENGGALQRRRQAVDCRYGSAKFPVRFSGFVRYRRDLCFEFPIGLPSETLNSPSSGTIRSCRT